MRKEQEKAQRQLAAKENPLSKQNLSAEVEEAFAKYDKDGNGTLDVAEATEFLTDWLAKYGKSEEAKVIEFEDLDINGDGVIDKEELT